MGESLRPDEVIAAGGSSSMQMRRFARDAALLLPNMVKLLSRLVKDARVPRRSKLVVGAALAYLASPIDLLPEFIPVVGLADDMLVVALALNHLISVAGDEVVLEHWDGPRDLLDLVRSTLDVATDLVPVKIKRLFRGMAGA
ncbi:MAG: YkvA family protein [Acidimicrobiia bacterium]|nr:YkvA family protein [Acidimicrobiia bacterium]MDH4306201.1 YkvA family protein [Acidimicrobiia bacterium]